MKQIGYGVMVNYKPSGLWPMSWDEVRKAKGRYEVRSPAAIVEVVPIYVGAAITVLAPVVAKEHA